MKGDIVELSVDLGDKGIGAVVQIEPVDCIGGGADIDHLSMAEGGQAHKKCSKQCVSHQMISLEKPANGTNI